MGIPEDAADIIMQSWRGGTRSTYKHYIQRWIQFCAQQKRDSVEPTVNSLITFLNILFNEGKNYNTLCVARSAISALSLKSEVSIGSYQLVKRFLTGCFNIKPALPRYSITWDPHMVFKLFKRLVACEHSIITSIEYESDSPLFASLRPERPVHSFI